jgi:flagellar biosynthesis/type III secretory pathway protein FliH
MIRRLQENSAREVADPRVLVARTRVAATELGAAGLTIAAAPEMDGYRQGYADGFAAGEDDGLREAQERMQGLEDQAHESMQELLAERERLAVLLGGLEAAWQAQLRVMDATAFEIALTSLGTAFGEMAGDRELLQRVCKQVAEGYRSGALQVAVSAQDLPRLPECVAGLEVVADPALAPGECRVLTSRGCVESSIEMRLQAIGQAMRESLGLNSA